MGIRRLFLIILVGVVVAVIARAQAAGFDPLICL
jgi:hypothetical protein